MSYTRTLNTCFSSFFKICPRTPPAPPGWGPGCTADQDENITEVVKEIYKGEVFLHFSKCVLAHLKGQLGWDLDGDQGALLLGDLLALLLGDLGQGKYVTEVVKKI